MTGFDRTIVFVAFSVATFGLLPIYWLILHLVAWMCSRLDARQIPPGHLAYLNRCRRRRVLQSQALSRRVCSRANR